jgi:hypothetical protein
LELGSALCGSSVLCLLNEVLQGCLVLRTLREMKSFSSVWSPSQL